MPILGRDSILQASDIRKELVAVPEWGGEVYVRSLSAKERDEFESSMLTFKGKTQEVNLRQARAKLAALSICDEEGKRLFSDADVAALGNKSASAMQRVWTVAQRLSAITEEDMEELTKNSGSARSEGSSSD
jgi:hypothetical protein